MRLGPKRYIFKSTRARKCALRFVFLCAISVLIFSLFFYSISVIRPHFCVLAEAKAKEISAQVINEVIKENFLDTISYDDIVSIERGEDGKITAVKSNLSFVSSMKSDLSLKIYDKLSEIDSSDLKIPLGSLSGLDILSGMGPFVSFDIKPYGMAETDILTDFSESGINQTKCSVLVSARASVSVLGLSVNKKSITDVSLPVIETVIVGDVPESFTHVDRDGYAFEDDVLQLKD